MAAFDAIGPASKQDERSRTPEGPPRLPAVPSRHRARSGTTKEVGRLMPIWLGSNTKVVKVQVKPIKDSIAEDLHHNANVLAVERFEGEAAHNELLKRYVMASECLEQALHLRRRMLGEQHEEVISAIEHYIVCCNTWSVDCLASGHETVSLELLKKAEVMTEPENVPSFARRVSLRAATFTNMSCYYRARGKLNAALQVAERALSIEDRFKQSETPALTRLNYAVLLSLVTRHEEALGHVEAAVATLQDELWRLGASSADTPKDPSAAHMEVLTFLVVAYYNMFIELTRLYRRQEGYDAAMRASALAQRGLPNSHPLVSKVEEGVAFAQEEMAKVPSPTTTSTVAAEASAAVIFELPHKQRRPSSAASIKTQQDVPLWKGLKSLADDKRITLRHQLHISEKVEPPQKPPEKRHLRRLHIKEQLYLKNPEATPVDPFFSSRPRTADSDGRAYVGSPSLMQQALGGTPMAQHEHDGDKETSNRTTPRTPAGARTPKTPAGAQTPLKSTQSFESGRSTLRLERSMQLDMPKAFRVEAITDPAMALTRVYEIYKQRLLHASEAIAANACEDEDARPAAPPSNDRLKAIRRMRARLEFRKEHGLPLPTDVARQNAARKIQAAWHAFQAKEPGLEELAKQAQRIEQKEALVPHRPDAPLPLQRPPQDTKRQVALRHVLAQRRAAKEQGAALGIQRIWRGICARRDIRAQVARMTKLAATIIQACWRRHFTICWLYSRQMAAIHLQSSWRRHLARRRAKRRRGAASCIGQKAHGKVVRNSLAERCSAAVQIQCCVRGYLLRQRLRRIPRAAMTVQRIFRGWRWRRELARVKAAATLIQAQWATYCVCQYQKRRRKAAMEHQRRWRVMCMCKALWKGHRRIRLAALKVSSTWRGHQLRRRKPYRASACLIQAQMRGVLQRNHLRKLPGAALRIQAWWRGHLVRQCLHIQVALAFALQRHGRRKLALNRLHNASAASVLCQRRVRGRRARRRVQQRHVAATQLQAFFRGVTARRRSCRQTEAACRVQAWFRKVVQLKRYSAFRCGVATIWRAWLRHKGHVARQRHRKAALRLTALCRGHLVRSRLRARHRAAACLQRAWQAYAVAKLARRREVAAVKIQAAVRRSQATLRHRALRDFIAIRMQAHWRKRRQRAAYLHKRSLALKLQALWRGASERRRVQKSVKAARRLQAWWRRIYRGVLVKRANRIATRLQVMVQAAFARTSLKRRKQAVLTIQRINRGLKQRRKHRKCTRLLRSLARWLAARLQRCRFLRERKAAVRIQQAIRARTSHWRWSKLQVAVAKIKAKFRRYHVQMERDQREQAARLMQRLLRGAMSRIVQQRRKQAAIVIQKVARGRLARRRYATKMWLLRKLQALWMRRKHRRHLLAARHLHRLIVELNKGSSFRSTILARQHLANKALGIVRRWVTRWAIERDERAALRIQRHVRGYRARRRVYFMREVGAVKLQTRFRMVKARVLVERLRRDAFLQEMKGRVIRKQRAEKRRWQAATRIQACHRRRQQRRHYLNIVRVALPRIQAFCHMLRDRAAFRERLQVVLRLQSGFRVLMAKRHLTAKQQAASQLQRWFRKTLASYRLPEDRLRPYVVTDFAVVAHAALKIQAAWRTHRQFWSYLRLLVAVVRIQAQARTWLERRRWRTKVKMLTKIQKSLVLPWVEARRSERLHAKILKIQAFFRGCAARRAVRRRLAALSFIQVAWRSASPRNWLAHRGCRAAVKIQAFVRMRRQVRVARPKREAAIRCIQANTHGFLARRRFQRQRVAARMIQRLYMHAVFWRTLLQRRWLILSIQRIFRGRRTRRKVQVAVTRLRRLAGRYKGWYSRKRIAVRLVAAVCTIQSFLRGRRTRMMLVTRASAALRLQAWWRRIMVHDILQLKRKARAIIEGWRTRRRLKRRKGHAGEVCAWLWKTTQTRSAEEHRMHVASAVAPIQRVARGRQARTRVARMRVLVRLLQQHARRCLARGRARRRLRGAGVLQTRLRSALRQREYMRRRQQVLMIQTWARARAAWATFKRKAAAAVRIQRIYRGHRVRLRLHRRRVAATVLSKNIRCWLTGCGLRRKKRAAIRVQAVWRGCLVREDVRMQSRKAARIATAWRCHAAYRRYHRMRWAGSIIVSAAIMWRQRRLRQIKAESASRIARAWRFSKKPRVRDYEAAACKIQRQWRFSAYVKPWVDFTVQCRVFEHAMKQHRRSRSATIIQRWWRRMRLKPTMHRIARWAATKLQAAFRQQLSMRLVDELRESQRELLESEEWSDSDSDKASVSSAASSPPSARAAANSPSAASVAQGSRSPTSGEEWWAANIKADAVRSATKSPKAEERSPTFNADATWATKTKAEAPSPRAGRPSTISADSVRAATKAEERRTTQGDIARSTTEPSFQLGTKVSVEEQPLAKAEVRYATKTDARMPTKPEARATTKAETRLATKAEVRKATKAEARRKTKAEVRRATKAAAAQSKEIQHAQSLRPLQRFQSWLHWRRFLSSIVRIQAAMRGHLVRRLYARKRAAAILLQAAWRGCQDRQHITRRVRAAICIQACARSALARKHLMARQEAAVKIQSHIRRYLVAKHVAAAKRRGLGTME